MLTNNKTFRRFMTVGLVAVMAIGLWSSLAGIANARGGHAGGRGGGRGFASRGRSAGRSFANRGRSFVNHSRGFRGGRAFSRNVVRRPRFTRPIHHGRYFGWGETLDGDGFVDADTAVVASAPITLLNPAETQQAVAYTLGADQDSLDPAQSKAYDDGTQVITFDRGGDFGQAQYTLEPGTYRFVATDQGWDLHTVTQ